MSLQEMSITKKIYEVNFGVLLAVFSVVTNGSIKPASRNK